MDEKVINVERLSNFHNTLMNKLNTEYLSKTDSRLTGGVVATSGAGSDSFVTIDQVQKALTNKISSGIALVGLAEGYIAPQEPVTVTAIYSSAVEDIIDVGDQIYPENHRGWLFIMNEADADEHGTEIVSNGERWIQFGYSNIDMHEYPTANEVDDAIDDAIDSVVFPIASQTEVESIIS